MDSGDTVDLTCVLWAPEDQDQPAPFVAVTTVVIGYEIDDYEESCKYSRFRMPLSKKWELCGSGSPLTPLSTSLLR
jgi:hypothetical protein